MTCALLLVVLAAKPLDAPITAVTVYSDRARVTRSARVDAGLQTVEFPLLLATSVDADSIRVEATGAEVRRVDIERIEGEKLPEDEAKKALAEVERLTDQSAATRKERENYEAVWAGLKRLQPTPPPTDVLHPPARLNPSGWSAALAFIDGWEARAQAKVRELTEKLDALARETQAAQARANLAGFQRRAGTRVTAAVQAAGPATVTLSYVALGARWYPTYDIQLAPETGQVDLSFYGQVTQQTGEDWPPSALTLSTAVPASSATFAELPSWRLGQRDQFVPVAVASIDIPTPAASGGKFGSLRGGVGGSAVSKSATFELEDVATDANRQRTDDFAIDGTRPSSPPSIPEVPAPGNAPAPSAPPPRQEPSDERDAEKKARYAEEEIVVTGTNGKRREAVSAGMPLAPPAGFVRPTFSADLPASAAGGYDLSYASLRPESVANGKSSRVALFAQKWPVQVERKLFPGVNPNAYLVAELKNPSAEPLPGGHGNLFVGPDPSGEAVIKLVSPGETFTLPLGIDRALKPIRNVKVVDAERGVIGKDDVSEYIVTTEVANPYGRALKVRIFDQWPLTDDAHVEVKLLKTEPYAVQDKVKGTLEWDLMLPAAAKTTVSFEYGIRRPRSWRLHQ